MKILERLLSFLLVELRLIVGPYTLLRAGLSIS